jgi:hypothetical protein
LVEERRKARLARDREAREEWEAHIKHNPQLSLYIYI